MNVLLASETYKKMQNIKVVGLMGMATNTDDESKIRNEFRKLKAIYDKLAIGNKQFAILSMGMSSDYKIAIEEGSTMVRVGSLIFGERYY